jgi:hypothetical protein
MLFGLYKGPATFQLYINEVLWDDLNKCCSVYIDDILVYSKDRKEYVEYVRKILGKLQRAGLQVDIKKCEFFVTETKFLGLIVSPKGISIDLERVRTIQE